MENNDYKLIWDEVLNQIKAGEQGGAVWFDGLKFREATETTVIIEVPSGFYMDQVKKRYLAKFESKIEELTGKKLAVNLIVHEKAAETDPKNPKISGTDEPDFKPGTSTAEKAAVSDKKPKKNPHFQLKSNYLFENYVVGENNAFAHGAAQAVARNPGTAYNPLLIYGGVGLGKTHLMQAIGNYVHEHSDNKVIYISAEDFTNEFIASLREDKSRTKVASFKNKYRHADFLLIDDIHFLQKKDGTQEELFYTFNALFNSNKQMVFTCDRPISELKDFHERLGSRMTHGLSADLLPPKYETRCAILKKKSETLNVSIPDDVINLVSKNISTNVRDLEGALHTLSAYAELLGKPITLEIARERLKDVFASPRQSNLSIEIIQRVVAEHHHLSINDLKSIKKTKSLVYPRQLAMYIIREITEYTTTEIGQAFGGRDHTTVMYSCDKIGERMKADPGVDSTIQSLIRDIKEYNAKS